MTRFNILITAVMLTVSAFASADEMTRICVTEWHGYERSSEADYRTRFAYYEELGVETLRLISGSFMNKPLMEALEETSFSIKMILNPTFLTHHYKEPGRMVDQFGTKAKSLGPWNAKFEETTRAFCERELKGWVSSGLADRVDEVVVGLGPASEPMYPANWTLKRSGEEGFWCYSEDAQDDFRDAMEEKYRSVGRANRAWKLRGKQRFDDFSDVVIPAPGTDWAKGQFWDDMLTWYRDSKREMTLHRISQTQELVHKYLSRDVKCIVYLPGSAYTEKDWEHAVQHADGKKSIRLMMDNDWLMEVAVEEGCVLQYTGVENAKEVSNIVRKLKKMRCDAYESMWGENAGVARVGLHPMQLADVITEYGLRGVDFTWGKWLFDEADGVTPTETFEEFRKTVEKIRKHYE